MRSSRVLYTMNIVHFTHNLAHSVYDFFRILIALSMVFLFSFSPNDIHWKLFICIDLLKRKIIMINTSIEVRSIIMEEKFPIIPLIIRHVKQWMNRLKGKREKNDRNQSIWTVGLEINNVKMLFIDSLRFELCIMFAKTIVVALGCWRCDVSKLNCCNSVSRE